MKSIIAVMGKGSVMMATCKECVHFELCEDWFNQIKEEGLVTGERSQCQCEAFKNKSDFQEVKHGKLNDITDFGNGVCFGYCSNCGSEHRAINPSVLKLSYRFCRWCGAKMDGV